MKTMNTPDSSEIETAIFLVKYWQYFMAGLASFAGVIVAVKKGKSETDMNQIMPLSENHIDNKLKICAGELQKEIRQEFKDDLSDLKTDLLREIKFMIEAAK